MPPSPCGASCSSGKRCANERRRRGTGQLAMLPAAGCRLAHPGVQQPGSSRQDPSPCPHTLLLCPSPEPQVALIVLLGVDIAYLVVLLVLRLVWVNAGTEPQRAWRGGGSKERCWRWLRMAGSCGRPWRRDAHQVASLPRGLATASSRPTLPPLSTVLPGPLRGTTPHGLLFCLFSQALRLPSRI